MLLINSLRNSIFNPALSAIWIYNKVFVNQAKTAKLIPVHLMTNHSLNLKDCISFGLEWYPRENKDLLKLVSPSPF